MVASNSTSHPVGSLRGFFDRHPHGNDSHVNLRPVVCVSTSFLCSERCLISGHMSLHSVMGNFEHHNGLRTSGACQTVAKKMQAPAYKTEMGGTRSVLFSSETQRPIPRPCMSHVAVCTANQGHDRMTDCCICASCGILRPLTGPVLNRFPQPAIPHTFSMKNIFTRGYPRQEILLFWSPSYSGMDCFASLGWR